jgi:hypothetical protein
MDELVFFIYLRRGRHLHMYVRHPLPHCHIGPAQLNMYEPAGSNRNMAYSLQYSAGARTLVVPPEGTAGVLQYQASDLVWQEDSVTGDRPSLGQKQLFQRVDSRSSLTAMLLCSETKKPSNNVPEYACKGRMASIGIRSISGLTTLTHDVS